MLKKATSTIVIIGAIAGAIVGGLLALTDNMLPAIPGLSFLYEHSPLSSFLTTTIIGAIVGVLIGFVAASTIGNAVNLSSKQMQAKNTLQLREERLDITKERVKTADVDIHKETITEDKTVTIPVTREEMVIETHTDNDPPATIRIPLTEEEIVIDKHQKTINDVNTYEQSFETTETIEADLRKEKLHLDVDGDISVTEKD